MPPYVPTLASTEDTSNFTDIPEKQTTPSVENFRTKTQFSGKHLPFVGFTYIRTHNSGSEDFVANKPAKDERVEELKKEIRSLERKVAKNSQAMQEKDNLGKKLEERSRKICDLEKMRERVERDLANAIVQCTVSFVS